MVFCMTNVKVSIIVAVYKAEKYLDRCMRSLLMQTFNDYEILLIDDGSPDRSGEICDDYARKYKFIRVIHKKNEGVSATRELGWNSAQGAYFIYVDPDDWVDQNYLLKLYNEASEKEADIVICDFVSECKNGSVYLSQKPSALSAKNILEDFFSKSIHGSMCNKLIRKTAFQKYHVHFDSELLYCEDLHVNCQLLKNDVVVSYIADGLYHYDQTSNTNSLVRNYNADTYTADINVWNSFLKLFSDIHEPKYLRRTMARNLVGRAFPSGVFKSLEFKKKFNQFAQYVKPSWSDLRSPKVFLFDIFYYFSCRGKYDQMYRLYLLLKKIEE